MDRRQFATFSAARLAATGLTLGATRLFAADASARPRFLLVFLRGGYDAANLLVPISSSFLL